MAKRSLMLAGGARNRVSSGVLQVGSMKRVSSLIMAMALVLRLSIWRCGCRDFPVLKSPTTGVTSNRWPRIDVNWLQLLRVFNAESFFELNPFRKKFFREWGLDFEKIRASPRLGTFNVYNFSNTFCVRWKLPS